MARLSLLAALGSVLSIASGQWTVGQVVDTTSGRYVGHPAAHDSAVSAYLGIQYAENPIGALRFMPPKRYPKPSMTLLADHFGPDCPQAGAIAQPRSNNSASASPMAQSVLSSFANGKEYAEDCLRLNVWTKPQTGEKSKAVLVWIHGGGFTSGSPASPSTSGHRFADDEDVVVVSINYRLNIFGFPGAPEHEHFNLGMMDQRMAVQWVKDNIAKFGGDPKRITIFGESAGGRAVDMFAFAWANETDPIVNGFIAQSGAAPATNGWRLNPDTWFELSTRLGCGGASESEHTLGCVRTKSMDEILIAAGSDRGKRPDILSRFTPVIDEILFYSDFDKRRLAGNFIKRPILAGTNDNEAGLYEFMALSRGQGKTPKEEQEKTNAAYNCGAAIAAKGRRDLNIPAWRYRWMGEFPNQRITPTAGAWHGR
jgi:cholinesterase